MRIIVFLKYNMLEYKENTEKGVVELEMDR